MKPQFSFLSTLIGTIFGYILCFAFYKVAGLTNTLLSSAPLMRQGFDFICIMAFVTFGVVIAQRCISALYGKSDPTK